MAGQASMLDWVQVGVEEVVVGPDGTPLLHWAVREQQVMAEHHLRRLNMLVVRAEVGLGSAWAGLGVASFEVREMLPVVRELGELLILMKWRLKVADVVMPERGVRSNCLMLMVVADHEKGSRMKVSC